MRVAELWRYPVKSLEGERLERVDVLADGLRGDRATRVLGPGGERITGRTANGLLGVQAALGDDGEPTVDGHHWDSDAALALIRRAAGEGSTLAPVGRHFDSLQVHIVTDGTVAMLGEDRRRLRPNIVIEGVERLEEIGWVGRRLRLGGVELDVRERCTRCVMTTIDPDTQEVCPDVLRRINEEFDRRIGLLCDVVVVGEVVQGDRVELLPAG